MSIEEIWRRKSDTELRQAAAELQDYRSDVRRVIAAELVRRGLRTADTIDDLQLPLPSRALLLAALQVTDADLQMNRSGLLTPAQQARLQYTAKSDARWIVGFTLLMAIPLYALLYFILQDNRALDVRQGISFSQFILLGVTAVFPTILLVAAWQALRLYQTTRRSQTVKAIEGEVELQRDYVKSAILYWLLIGKFRFAISQSIYLLLRNGHSCRIYYEPMSKTIVAIEPLERSSLIAE